MGDFAAGKLIDGVTFDPIMLDTFEQFTKDVDSHKDAEEAGFTAPPATGDALAQLEGLITPGTASELLLCLMQWHDGNFWVYDYLIHSADQIIADAQEGILVIGETLDYADDPTQENLLLLHTSDGALQAGGMLMQEDLAAYLGHFVFDLSSNKIEFAFPWVSVQK